MTDEHPTSVSDADVRSLAAKLKGLHALLTPGEQALLRSTLHRAAVCDGALGRETSGVIFGVSFNPFTYLDAIEAVIRREGSASGA